MSGRLREDYYSKEIETALPRLLEAHLAFEAGVKAELDGDQEGAMANWQKCMALLLEVGEPGKPWLRRVNAALAERTISDLHHKNKIPEMLAILDNTQEIINRNPLPETESSPTEQLGVEHWLRSSRRMFLALQQIETAPRDYESQMRILRQSLHEVCAERLLMEKLSEQQQPDSHEQIVDRAIFKADLTKMFTSLFYNIHNAGKSLPNSAQAVWTALLAAWATEATNEHLTPAALDLANGKLSSLEAVDQFRALVEAVQILDGYQFPDARPKLAKGLSFLNPEACPHDENALILADVLIEGGYGEKAYPYLEIAEKSGLVPEAQSARIKLLYYAREYREAIAVGTKAFNDETNDSKDKLPTETRFWLAKALLKSGDQKAARERFREFYEAAPASKQAPEACLLTGMLSFNLDEPEKAIRFYKETYIRYPASLEGQRAAELLVNE